MGKLDSRHSAFRTNEVGDSAHRFDLLIAPQASATVCDAPFRLDRCGLNNDNAGPSGREFAVMDKMPIISETIASRIQTHG
jgi:hypothetical protein